MTCSRPACTATSAAGASTSRRSRPSFGLGRATIYRWFGDREQLLGEVIIRATEPVLATARTGLAGKGGPGLLETFDRFNRALADAPALRPFVEQERDTALRIVASGAASSSRESWS